MMLSKNSSNNYCNQADLPGLFLNPLGKVVSNFNRDLGTFVQIGDMFQFVLRQLLGPRPNWHPLILKKNQDKLKWDLIASRFVLTDDNYKPFFLLHLCMCVSIGATFTAWILIIRQVFQHLNIHKHILRHHIKWIWTCAQNFC